MDSAHLSEKSTSIARVADAVGPGTVGIEELGDHAGAISFDQVIFAQRLGRHSQSRVSRMASGSGIISIP